MAASNARPGCLVTNPVAVDTGTSALICSPAPYPTGRPASFSPEQLWAEVVSGPLPLASQDKVFTLSHNLQLFERLQSNIAMTPAQVRPHPLLNPDLYQAYAERMQARKQWVNAIAQSQRIVKELNEYDLNLRPEQLEELKGYLYKRLLAAAPYYTQMANLNLLADGHKAWTRTCNVTSLSMALEALGVGPQNFTGDVARLQRIANTLEVWRYKTDKNDKTGIGAACYSDVTTMRLPDLLQFVAVYTQCPMQIDDLRADAYLKKIQAARDLAAKRITTYEMLITIAGLFGVKCSEIRYVASYGEKEIGHAKTIANLDKAMEKLHDGVSAPMAEGSNLEDNLPLAYYKAQREELEEKVKLADLKKDYSPKKMDEGVKTYRRQILERIAPELKRGNQIFLHRPGVISGHYMKLHDIEPTGIDAIGLYIDDPWSPGKHAQLTWREAYKEGYFDSYMIMSR